MTAVTDWIRALPQRYGKRTLIALGVIALLGLVIRAYVVVDPVEHPGDDSRAYYALSKALYEEQSFGGREFEDSSDWSPGAPFRVPAPPEPGYPRCGSTGRARAPDRFDRWARPISASLSAWRSLLPARRSSIPAAHDARTRSGHERA